MIFWPRIGYLFASWLRASCCRGILGDEGNRRKKCPRPLCPGSVPQGLKSLRETPHCVVPPGLDLREILPGTSVPGYGLSRPFGTDCVG
jgi:hypothetical protein